MAGNLIPPAPGEALQPASAPLPQLPEEAAPMHPAAYPVAPEEGGVQWGRYIAAVKRYKWMILLIILVGTGLGILATRFVKPEYQVQATLFIQPETKGSGPMRPEAVLPSNAWVQLLSTYAILDAVVQKERLYLQYDSPKDSTAFHTFNLARMFQPGAYVLSVDDAGRRYVLKTDDGRVVEQGAVGGPIGARAGFQWLPPAGSLGRDRSIKFRVMPPRDASNQLKGSITPLMGDDANFLQVLMTGSNPVRTAGTLNALLDEFVTQAAALKKQKLTETAKVLNEQLASTNQKLKDAEAALESYRAKTITQPNEANTPIVAGLQQTTPTATGRFFQDKYQLEDIRHDREALEGSLGKLRSGQLAVDAFAQIPAVQRSPDLQATLTELSKAEADLRTARLKYTDSARQVQDIQDRIRTIRSQTIPSYASALVSTLRDQERDIAGRIRDQARDLQAMPGRTIEEARLARNVENLAGLYAQVAARQLQAQLEEASALPDVSIVDRASVPETPSSNSAPRIILMAFLASVGLAFGLAILLDQLDKRFRYPDQVTRELGLSILGAIPAIKNVRPGERDAEEAAQVVEAFRTVRMNLAHSYGAAGPVLVTISSPGAGDGKSLIASNLALSFAEAGYRTVLVDGDIRRGELHRMFNTDRRPGLLDLLMGQATLEQVLRPTTHKNLSMVPCGTRHQHGPELLGSSAMRDLMATLKTRFNVVIVDSPPLGAGIDPFVLSTTTGNLLLVLRSGASDRQMAEEKLKLVDRLPVRVLGAVLNDIRADGVYKYYSYIYGYALDEEEDAPQLAATSGKRG
ncbi:MAG TPA: polysaccharide biosynthesis tyrosine autokinase [Gemmatimonadales bacterium]|nr:polysaccharide biosynthesis tyrosine autokinase [Gemmatimonadales bacterium]